MNESNEKVYYAGIGSRSTPEHIQEVMVNFGREMARRGYVLRSGGADGADSAFEEGCDLENGEKQIFIPWEKFNNRESEYVFEKMEFKNEALEIASKFHPKWQSLKYPVKKLMGRNTFQVLGPDLKLHTNFIIYYAIEDRDGNPSGGTAQAIRISKSYGIKSYNLFVPETLEKIKEKIK